MHIFRPALCISWNWMLSCWSILWQVGFFTYLFIYRFFFIYLTEKGPLSFDVTILRKRRQRSVIVNAFFFNFLFSFFFLASVLRFWIIRVWPCLNTAIDILFSQILPVDLKKKYLINEICTCNVNIFSFWTSNVAQ